MENKEEKSIENNVLEKIEKGEVKMHSKTFFNTKNVLLGLALFASLLLAIYFFSFILFSGSRSGLWFLPIYSFGIMVFLLNFPWLLLFFVVLSAIILEYLLNRYSVSYKKPLIYSLLLVVTAIILLGSVLHFTSLHGYLYNKGAPAVTNFYDKFDMPGSENIHRGVVLGTNENGFLLEDEEGGILNISYDKIPKQMIKNIRVGEEFIVFGQENNNNTIKAIGVHKIPERKNCPPIKQKKSPIKMK